MLLAVLGVCGAATMLTGAVIISNGALDTGAREARSDQEDVCLTADCAVAGREC